MEISALLRRGLPHNVQCKRLHKGFNMKPEIREEIVVHAVRWCINILVEVLGNHAESVSGSGRDKLREAIVLLEKAVGDFRNRAERGKC